ncbi:hypothetical protein AGLY_011594 [Aphis glycines]|uniref:Uncharacterized protein n=1 Tax=Aphis glycines TaxID=307491 RepID=A0A6G0TBK2_APHGL|nr:hypothetical protein AGLY_011594 [Aphis glycines]
METNLFCFWRKMDSGGKRYLVFGGKWSRPLYIQDTYLKKFSNPVSQLPGHNCFNQNESLPIRSIFLHSHSEVDIYILLKIFILLYEILLRNLYENVVILRSIFVDSELMFNVSKWISLGGDLHNDELHSNLATFPVSITIAKDIFKKCISIPIQSNNPINPIMVFIVSGGASIFAYDIFTENPNAYDTPFNNSIAIIQIGFHMTV